MEKPTKRKLYRVFMDLMGKIIENFGKTKVKTTVRYTERRNLERKEKSFSLLSGIIICQRLTIFRNFKSDVQISGPFSFPY